MLEFQLMPHNGRGLSIVFATEKPESMELINVLYAGLQNECASSILIEGHTSSEGSDVYNQGLSERHAASVRELLIEQGIAPDRIGVTGIGESRPVASNDHESGRSLNRRVEIHCSE